jgi:hypothetical protein
MNFFLASQDDFLDCFGDPEFIGKVSTSFLCVCVCVCVSECGVVWYSYWFLVWTGDATFLAHVCNARLMLQISAWLQCKYTEPLDSSVLIYQS